MNIPYLLKVLKTDKFSELVGQIDLVPLDMNLELWASEEAGEIAVDVQKDHVELLIEPTPSSNDELANKLIRTMQHYAKKEINVTRGRLNTQIKEQGSNIGYPYHEYIMTLEHLIEQGLVVEDVVKVPKTKKHPANEFAFLSLAENAEFQEEWNAKEVNNWIARFEQVK